MVNRLNLSRPLDESYPDYECRLCACEFHQQRRRPPLVLELSQGIVITMSRDVHSLGIYAVWRVR